MNIKKRGKTTGATQTALNRGGFSDVRAPLSPFRGYFLRWGLDGSSFGDVLSPRRRFGFGPFAPILPPPVLTSAGRPRLCVPVGRVS